MRNKLFSFLGITKKAGKLIEGFDVMERTARKGQVFLIVLAGDVSDRSRRAAERVAEETGTRLITAPITMDEIWFRIGKRAGILAISDRGLANKVEELVSRVNEEE